MQISIRVRGMIFAEISKKSLRLKESEAKKAASITLMNTDTETVLYGVNCIHTAWGLITEVAFNVYILSTIVKQASFLFVFPAICKFFTY